MHKLQARHAVWRDLLLGRGLRYFSATGNGGELILELKTFQDGGEFECFKCNRRQEMGKCGGGWYHEVYSVCLDCDSLPHAAVAWLGRSQARAVEAASFMSGGPDVTPPPGPKKIRRATPAKDGGDRPAEESRGEEAG